MVISAGLAALRGSIFRGRQIAPAARAALRASAARTSATASPTATTAAIAAPVSAAIIATIPTAAKILARTVVAASGIILRGIVMRRKVLRRRSVGIRLAFLGRFGVLVVQGSGRHFAVMLFKMFAFRGLRFFVGSVPLIRAVKLFRMKLFVLRVFVMFSRARQGLAGEHFNGRAIREGQRGSRSLRLLVRMPVIVILEVFENVADIQESVAIEPNVHESGLHAGEDAGDFSFVDAADEGEFFFALDVNFD